MKDKISQYARWILTDCSDPVDEIEGLIYSLDPDVYRQRIYQELMEEIDEMFTETKSFVVVKEKKTTERLLSRSQTADLLDISLVTLYKWVKNGLIPCYKIGGKVYFKYDQVIESIKLKN